MTSRLWTPPQKAEKPEPPRGLHRALMALGLQQRALDAQRAIVTEPRRPRASQEVRRRRRAVKAARKANRS